MFGIGSMELLVILVVALLIFGPDRLPELARSLAKGLREVRKAADDIKSQVEVEELIMDKSELMNRDESRILAPATDESSIARGTGLEDGPAEENSDTDAAGNSAISENPKEPLEPNGD